MTVLVRFACLLSACVLSAACSSPEPPPPPSPPATTGAPVAAAPAATGSAAAPAAAAAQPAQSVSVAQRLAQANAAYAAMRILQPTGNNAVEGFLDVLAVDPGNRSARDALIELFPMVTAAAQRAIAAGDVVEADRIIALLARATPDSMTVADLRDRLQRLIAERDATAARAAAATARAAAASRSAATSASVQPIAEPTQPATRPVVTAPAPAPTSSASNPPQTASNAAATNTATPVTSRSTAAAQSAAASAPTDVAAAPTTTSAASAAPGNTSQRVEPQVLQRVDPSYPQLARQRRVEGWVDLEFTVGIDGRATDIRVLANSPGAIFDTAATRALQRWRFRPGTRNGTPEPMRTRARITFRLG